MVTEEGRLEKIVLAITIVAAILVVAFLLIPIAKIQAPYLQATIAAAAVSVEPGVLEAPPLQSTVVISRLLLGWTIMTLVLTVIYWRKRLGLDALAILGFMVSVQLMLAQGLVRTVVKDVLPVIARAETVPGEGWTFIFQRPSVEYTLIAEAYPALTVASILVFIASTVLMLRASHSATRTAMTMLLILLIVAMPIEAAVYTGRGLVGAVQVGEPVIWYEDPGRPGVNVSLTAHNSQARVNTSTLNIGLAVIDHNLSAGVVAQRSFVDGIDYTGDPYGFNFTWSILGFRMIEDPAGAGVVLGEAYLEWTTGSGATRYAWISAYVEPDSNDTITIGYATSSASDTCGIVNVSEWGLNITIYGDLLNDVFEVYVNGEMVCTLDGVIFVPYWRVDALSFIMGRYDPGNMYELYIDDINLTVTTSSGTLQVIERFQDGIDDVFSPIHGAAWWYDTYYTSPTGSSPTPPADGSIGLTLLGIETTPVLNIASSLENGTRIPTWTRLEAASCTRDSTTRTIAIRVDEVEGVPRALIWVNLTLNSSNFGDWEILAADGSNIYFTLPNGQVTLHHIQQIDPTAQSAVIQVLVPSLPSYRSAHLYMHYGGTTPYTSTVSFVPQVAEGVRLSILGPLLPVVAEELRGVNGNWTLDEMLLVNGTPLSPVSSTTTLQVLEGERPNLSLVNLFYAVPPGSDTLCEAMAYNVFEPTGNDDIQYGTNHTLTIRGGVAASYVSMSGLGLLAGRSGTGLSLDPDYIHWVYLNLTTGVYRFRYVSGTVERDANGTVTVLRTNLLDLSSLTWDERYALGPLVVFVNPYRAEADYTFTIRDINGVDHVFTLPALVNDQDLVSLDIAVAWEDLWWPNTGASLDNYIDHVVRLTLFINGTARIEILFASGGYLHMFLLNSTLPAFDSIPSIVQKYLDNGYRLDPQDSVIYVKEHGAVVSTTSGQVWDPVNGEYKYPPLIFYVKIK